MHTVNGQGVATTTHETIELAQAAAQVLLDAGVTGISIGITLEDSGALTQLQDTAARQKRTELLAGSDWTQLPDVPTLTSELWKPYRQALRDLTIQPDYPVAITWPTVP